MKFLDKGDYKFDQKSLEVSAEHDSTPYRVHISVDVFQEQFGATGSGDFHEYWSLLQQHKETLEHAAKRQLDDKAAEANGNLVLTNSHF